MGKSLDVAWERAFIHPLLLINNIRLLSYTRAHRADSMAEASINMLLHQQLRPLRKERATPCACLDPVKES
jgi:hypothetical protein